MCSLWSPKAQRLFVRTQSQPTWVALLALSASCLKGEQVPAKAEPELPVPIAHLEQVVPEVHVRPGNLGAEVVGDTFTSLRVGDLVTTGAAGAVDVVFDGNDRIHLGPDASLLLEAHGGEGTEVGAVVLQGAVRAMAGARGVGLALRSPFGTARMAGAQVAVLDVSVERGLAVQLGEVALEQTGGGQRMGLQVGQVVTMASAGQADGLVVSNFAPTADLAPLTFNLPQPRYGKARGLRGVATLASRGAENWRPVAEPTPVGNGDRLHVGKGGAVAVELGDRAQVTLLSDTNVAFGGVDLKPERHGYAFAVDNGTLQLEASRQVPLTAQAVAIAGTELTVLPGAARADVRVQSDGNRADVLVRYGTASLSSGERVRAGERATIVDGKLLSTPKVAFPHAVPVIEGRPAVVYYQKAVPAIRFQATGAPKAEAVVAFGRDVAFKEAGQSEQLTNAAFVTDDVKAGRTWWRVDGARATSLDVLPEPARARDANARRTELDDNGTSAHVYYQNVMPNVALHWAPHAHASRYEVVVESARTSQTPPWRLVTADQSVEVPNEVWHDGRFVWRVTPLAEDGRALTRPQNNGLRLTHDTEVQGLRLREIASVTQADKPQGAVQAEGDVEAGCSLFIDGQAVALDRRNRFKHLVTLRRGDNQLVFALRKQGRPDRIYLRSVRFDPVKESD